MTVFDVGFQRSKTEEMAKMNWDEGRGGDDDFAGVGEEPTIPARYAGTCATCGQRFAVGDPIASIVVDKKPSYHHRACRYPTTALLSQKFTGADGEPAGGAHNPSKPAKVQSHDQQGQAVQQCPSEGSTVLRSASHPACGGKDAEQRVGPSISGESQRDAVDV